MEIKNFSRKSFDVEGVQVTHENMHEVAEWCGGRLLQENDGVQDSAFIKVNVRHPLNKRQTKAYVGDWVLKTARGFKVYTNEALEKNFDGGQSASSSVFDTPEELFTTNEPVDPKDAISGKR